MRFRAIKAGVIACLVFALTSPAPAGSAQPVEPPPVKVYRGTFQAAEGLWLVRSKGKVRAYLVFAYRIGKPLGSSRTFVIADRSRCRLQGARKRLASCSFGGRRREVRRGALRFDPLLGGAELRFRGHRLTWVGEELQEPTLEPWIDPSLMEADAYLERFSSVRGTMFNDRMRPRTLDHASLSYGVYAGAMLGEDPLPIVRRSVTVELPQGF